MNKKHDDVNKLVDYLFRNEYGKVVSYLTHKFGINFLENAEDIAQETLETAFQNWSFNGIPENPEGWIFVVSRNKAINFIKKNNKMSFLDMDLHIKEVWDDSKKILLDKEIEDSMLRMIFVCCSTKLSTENQIILILSTLCGFNRREISHALLREEENIKKRLYRSKKKIRETNIALNIPKGGHLKSKLDVVCNALYILFNEGYNSSSNKQLIRRDICLESMRLVKLLLKHFPNETKLIALYSLMCFHVARFESRIDDKGAIILFKDQDRENWNNELIKEGIMRLSSASKGNLLSSYHIEAGIAMQHCRAKNFESTDWKLIYKLYLQLLVIQPSPIIKLNLAIVDSKISGIDSSIKELEKLKTKNIRLQKYYLLYATLGEFYKIKNDQKNARINFDIAIKLTSSEQEKELLNRKMVK